MRFVHDDFGMGLDANGYDIPASVENGRAARLAQIQPFLEFVSTQSISTAYTDLSRVGKIAQKEKAKL